MRPFHVGTLKGETFAVFGFAGRMLVSSTSLAVILLKIKGQPPRPALISSALSIFGGGSQARINRFISSGHLNIEHLSLHDLVSIELILGATTTKPKPLRILLVNIARGDLNRHFGIYRLHKFLSQQCSPKSAQWHEEQLHWIVGCSHHHECNGLFSGIWPKYSYS